eukprot:COSAG05_NODE_2495_length_2983_cov_12.675535_3_plen_100_part_00
MLADSWLHLSLPRGLATPPMPCVRVQILDYLTQWSGITEELLRDVTATVIDAQNAVLELIRQAAWAPSQRDSMDGSDDEEWEQVYNLCYCVLCTGVVCV